MKTVLLTIKQLKSFISRNTLVFSIFFTGITFAVLIMIYAYGNIVPTKYMETVTFPSYRTVEVVFPAPVQIEEEHLTCLDAFGIQDVCVKQVSDLYIPASNAYLVLQSFRDNNNGDEIVFCPLFEAADLTGDNIILLTSYLGDTITLDGVQYDIVNKVSFLTYEWAFIPMYAFQSHQIPADAISYTLADFPSMSELVQINRALQAQFPDGTIVNPPSRFEGLDDEDKSAILSISIIFLIASILFFILLQYMVRENAPEYTVYGMVGAGRGHIFTILLVQNLIFFLCAFLLAAALHIGFYPFFDRWLNFSPGVIYYAWEYGLLLGLVMGLSVIAQLPFVWRYTTKTLADMRAALLRYGGSE